MPHKNTSIHLTLLVSVFMMMFVASLFHLPNSQNDNGLLSNFFVSEKVTETDAISDHIDNHTISSYTIGYLPQE